MKNIQLAISLKLEPKINRLRKKNGNEIRLLIQQINLSRDSKMSMTEANSCISNEKLNRTENDLWLNRLVYFFSDQCLWILCRSLWLTSNQNLSFIQSISIRPTWLCLAECKPGIYYLWSAYSTNQRSQGKLLFRGIFGSSKPLTHQ